MKLKKYAYLYSKLGNYTLKIMKKYLGNLLKNLEKSWKYHGILSVRKSGNPEKISVCPTVLHSENCSSAGGGGYNIVFKWVQFLLTTLS